MYEKPETLDDDVLENNRPDALAIDVVRGGLGCVLRGGSRASVRGDPCILDHRKLDRAKYLETDRFCRCC